MSHLLKSTSNGHIDKKAAQQLRFLAKNSIVASNNTLSIQVKHTISPIELLNNKLGKVEAEMTDIMKFNDSVIMTFLDIIYINALFHFVGKLVRIIWKMLTNEVEFNLN